MQYYFKENKKVTDLTLLTVRLILVYLMLNRKYKCMQQQRETMRSENTKSIFIRGPKMKASSGGWGSQIRATTQISVLRKRVMQKQRRLRKREIEEEEERERILNREPCGKIKPEDSEH